ncbi:MAG: PASTA domain-containing protein, partial [Specibacter sp.]
RRAWMTTLFVLLAIALSGGAVLGYNLLNPRPVAVEQVSIPSLTGFSKDDALTQLLDLGLEPHSNEEFSTTVDSGDVIRTDPGTGALVNPQSMVEVFFSKGPSEVEIPKDLAGKTEGEVRDNLAALNLKFNSNEFVTDPVIGANLVVTTDPPPGEGVPVGSSVTLKISNGQVVMPSLFDLTKDPKKVKDAVAAALKKASPYLELEWEEAENSVVTPGMVTNQSVTAGIQVAQRTTVVVTLAKAPETAKPTPASSPSSSPRVPPKTSDPAPPKN